MKQKRQIAILSVLLVAAAIVWGWNFHDKPVVTADASPTTQDAPPPLDVTNPHIRIELIEHARNAEYKGSGRNPFSSAAAPAVVAQTAKAEKKIENYGPWQKPPDPPPPPLTLGNIKFYGYGSVNGASRHAFFTDGDGEVQILGEGDVLLKRFRIVRIGNDRLEYEEISTGRTGTVPLEEQAAPGAPQ